MSEKAQQFVETMTEAQKRFPGLGAAIEDMMDNLAEIEDPKDAIGALGLQSVLHRFALDALHGQIAETKALMGGLAESIHRVYEKLGLCDCGKGEQQETAPEGSETPQGGGPDYGGGQYV